MSENYQDIIKKWREKAEEILLRLNWWLSLPWCKDSIFSIWEWYGGNRICETTISGNGNATGNAHGSHGYRAINRIQMKKVAYHMMLCYLTDSKEKIDNTCTLC